MTIPASSAAEIRSAPSVEAATGIELREPWTKPTGTRIRGSPASSAGSSARIDRPSSAERSLAKSQLGHRRCALRNGEVRRPDEPHLLERQLVVGGAGRRQFVELARPRPHGLRRPAEDLLVELRPASVADRTERVDGQYAEDPLRHRLRDVEGEVPAPRMADHECPLPAERVEDAAGIPDIGRHV